VNRTRNSSNGGSLKFKSIVEQISMFMVLSFRSRSLNFYPYLPGLGLVSPLSDLGLSPPLPGYQGLPSGPDNSGFR